jgi:hypothetical protein
VEKDERKADPNLGPADRSPDAIVSGNADKQTPEQSHAINPDLARPSSIDPYRQVLFQRPAVGVGQCGSETIRPA